MQFQLHFTPNSFSITERKTILIFENPNFKLYGFQIANRNETKISL